MERDYDKLRHLKVGREDELRERKKKKGKRCSAASRTDVAPKRS